MSANIGERERQRQALKRVEDRARTLLFEIEQEEKVAAGAWLWDINGCRDETTTRFCKRMAEAAARELAEGNPRAAAGLYGTAARVLLGAVEEAEKQLAKGETPEHAAQRRGANLRRLERRLDELDDGGAA